MKGTPNRRTVAVIERLEALGCDPLEGMARIAMDPEAPLELRGRMYAELAQYVYPKRRTVEEREQTQPIIVSINTFSAPTREPVLVGYSSADDQRSP